MAQKLAFKEAVVALGLTAESVGSIVDFTRRRPEDQAHATKRVYPENVPLDDALSLSSYPEHQMFVDVETIRNSNTHKRLGGVSQFMLSSDARHNRASHTLHVSMIARTIARHLGMGRQSEDLVAAIANSHDIGHPPFAHDGEEVLRRIMREKYNRLWNHDIAGLLAIADKVRLSVTHPGMNLTIGVVEGVTKRYWRYWEWDPDAGITGHKIKAPVQPNPRMMRSMSELPSIILSIDAAHSLYLSRFNHMEGQIASVSDWIAFTVTDIEDGLSNGIFTYKELFRHYPMTQEIHTRLKERYPKANERSEGFLTEFLQALKERLITETVHHAQRTLLKAYQAKRKQWDALAPTEQRIRKRQHKDFWYADDVRDLDALVMSFPPDIIAGLEGFREFCKTKAWPRVRERSGIDPHLLIQTLFDDLCKGVGKIAKEPLDSDWGREFHAISLGQGLERERKIAQFVCEYITMTYSEPDVMQHIRQYHPDLLSSSAKISGARQQASTKMAR